MDTTAPDFRTLYHCGTRPRTLPPDHYDAMDWFHRASSGHHMTALPGHQPAGWVLDYLRGLERHDDVFEVAFEPERAPDADPDAPAGYDAHYQFRGYRVRKGRTLLPEHVAYGDVFNVRWQVEELDRMREEHWDLVETPTLVSVPSPIDLALFTFLGPSFHRMIPDLRAMAWALRWLPVFTEAQINFVNAVTIEHGDKVVFNLEMPSALVGMWKARIVPGMPRLVARWHARQTAAMMACFVGGPRVIAHECYGDYEHTAAFEPRDLTYPVMYANELLRACDLRLVAPPELHMPATWGDRGPLIREKFYAPLTKLHPRWQGAVHAGVVHEASTLKSALAVTLFEEALGGPACSIGFPCGWGRRDEQAAGLAAQTLSTVADFTSGTSRAGQFEVSGVALPRGTGSDVGVADEDPRRED